VIDWTHQVLRYSAGAAQMDGGKKPLFLRGRVFRANVGILEPLNTGQYVT